jgi:MoaA/NifB/PqqE/SkfB family radical SAM enzyme
MQPRKSLKGICFKGKLSGPSLFISWVLMHRGQRAWQYVVILNSVLLKSFDQSKRLIPSYKTCILILYTGDYWRKRLEFNPLERLETSENKSWCPIPWSTCSVTSNGSYRLCVQANTHRETRGVYIKDSGETATVENTPLKDSRNQPLVKEIRQFMLRGERHPVCQRCNTEDDNKIISRRALARFNYQHHSSDLTLGECERKTSIDGSIEHQDFPILEIDLRLGNKCNLKCRSCYPGESSGWYKEWYATKGNKFKLGNEAYEISQSDNGQIRIDKNSFSWMERSEFFKNLHRDAPFVQYAHLVGGEPLLIEEHFEALQHFIEIGKASAITLDYNSNVSVIPNRLIDLWKNFKEVRLGYSIDGIGRVNDYIRNPSQWSEIEKNIFKLDQSLKNISMWPTVTIMAYNVFYIPEIIKWQIQSNFKNQNHSQSLMLLVHHPLHNPVELNAQVLPTYIKENIKKRYEYFEQEELPLLLASRASDKQDKMYKKWIYIKESILNHMFQKDLSQFFPHFCKRTQQMDDFRNESLKESLPEFYSLIKEEWLKQDL